MLGTDAVFSSWVSHAFDKWKSSLDSSSAIRRLNSSTSRVVIPSRVLKSLSRSPASIHSPLAEPHSQLEMANHQDKRGLLPHDKLPLVLRQIQRVSGAT